MTTSVRMTDRTLRGPVTALVHLVQPVAEQPLAERPDLTELAAQHLVGCVRPEFETVVRFDPIVTNGRQDDDVGRREVVGEPGVVTVGDAWVHFDVPGAGV